MKTSVWGKHAWEFLHACSFEYPDDPSDQDKLAAKALFRSLVRMLPCDDCCRHYHQEMEQDPIENSLGSKEELMSWVLRLHNKVNQRLGKPTLTLQDMFDKYKGVGCSTDQFLPGSSVEASSPTPLQGGSALAAPLTGFLVGGVLVGIGFILSKRN